MNNIKYITVAWMLLLIANSNVIAQAYPEIPSSISFGGINVKLDRSAQDIIEEDVKNLMSNKKFWEEKMDRAVLHFPIVEGILMDEEVPIDFKYLAVQESSFRPDVVSSSNAVGYWQFKPETARELNLRVDNDVDERKNISASTHAAAWYLKKNNQQFNNWVTTLYSYYQGAGGVKKVVPADWAYAREVTLTGKTDRYMLRFFAHKIALEAGIEKYKTANKLVLLEADYGKGKTLDDISASLGVSSADLKSFNRWLTDDKIPNDRQYLVTIPVPADQLASVREKLSLPPQQTAVASVYEDTGYPVLKKMPANSSDPNGPDLYEINGLAGAQARAGDKPKTLAKAGRMSAPKFMRFNDMVAEMQLIPGQVYYLAKKHKKASTPFHTARPGDTWHSVSQQYGIRLVSLLKYNRTTSRNYPIQTGQVLFLTKKRPKKQPIEIIAPPQPSPGKKDSVIAKKEDVIAAAPAANTNVIPDKPSGRKKYTPVLVEKKEETASAPAIANPPVTNAPVAAATPAAANIQTNPTVKTATNVPASVPTEPVSQQAGDRVVIITQDNADTSFKSAEERPVATSSSPSKVVTPNDTRAASETSVYMKQRAAAEERAAREAAAEPKTAAPEKPAATEKASFHTVQSGDTYFSIASKYSLTLRELIALNKNTPGRLVVGQRLNVSKGAPAETASAAPASAAPARETPAKATQEPEKITVVRTEPAETFKTPEEIKHETRTATSSGSEYHVVQGGQTYYSISKAYGLSVKELYDLNDLNGASPLKSGQRLRVRRTASEAPAAAAPSTGSRSSATQTHTVAAGETLFRISQTYHTNVEDIKRLNNMSGNSVMVGQKLKIPQQ
ncbi:LysM peptidoglycan-binding domain-containing protein [Dyadobacter chenhuakuii]|uniref:LysM peptidoglycan-binding domain-containing protein n=1 Tax=Dyadobacter chenhuakuii TaxID=2909339 RepID=A0ABY4XKY6_9BACT|nr:LysM peptidoglycan-binding domain-containing protein [Dyadobacter chenhuakuii]MCF2493570.1 LysM peptidoglycan-binding domain-containing protein [Dyadobacter chenhuakuii]USJ30708.1 LysM peptidoglycan-binding domain-containing protein [Dyadobacter chenhuakuii]